MRRPAAAMARLVEPGPTTPRAVAASREAGFPDEELTVRALTRLR
ncbi:hypothetical protein [Paracoccus sp. ME4]